MRKERGKMKKGSSNNNVVGCSISWKIVWTTLALMFSNAAFTEEEIEEIIVTGSYIRSAPADSPSPLSVISAADIEDNHIIDMNELLTRIPYQSGGFVQTASLTGGDFQGRLKWTPWSRQFSIEFKLSVPLHLQLNSAALFLR